MYLECPHWACRLETASEGDPRARGNVGSGDLADHKTTARPPERVPGRLTYPFDAVVAADGRLGGLGDDKALCRLARKGGVPGPSKPAEMRLGCLSRWDEEPRAPSAGYRGACRAHGGRIWRESGNSGRCCSPKFAGWKPTSFS